MNKELHNAEMWLVNIDDRRLNIIDTLVKRLVNELKLLIKVYATEDRRGL